MEYAGFKKSEAGPVRWGQIATKITGDIAKVEADREKSAKRFKKALMMLRRPLGIFPRVKTKTLILLLLVAQARPETLGWNLRSECKQGDMKMLMASG